MGRLGKVGTGVLVFLALGSLSVWYFNRQPEGAPVIFPAEGWATDTPEHQGIDSEYVAESLEAIRDEGLNIHSLTIVRRGHLILEAYFYPYDGNTPHELASVTKSVMTTLIGIAADQGKLELDQPIVSFFPDRTIANRDGWKERITVRHLAGMSSGLECEAEPDEPTLDEMRASPDWVQFVLDREVVSEPGTVFVYCSPGMHLLSAILQQATGETALEFARANLFGPLGIEDVLWPADPQGHSRGWGDIYLHPLDAARLGYLWLRGGDWDGNQIVSREWVESSSSTQIETGRDDAYGHGFWVMTGGDSFPEFAAIGRGGQRIGVLPTLDIVIVTTGGGLDPAAATDRLAPALIDPDKSIPDNPAGMQHLERVLDDLTMPPKPAPVRPLPAIAQEISGRTYLFDTNPLGLASQRLDFDGSDEAAIALTFSNDEPDRTGKIGLDGVYRTSSGRNGFSAGFRGEWQDEETFILEYDEIANRDAYTVRMRFTNDSVALEIKERTYQAAVAVTGTAALP